MQVSEQLSRLYIKTLPVVVNEVVVVACLWSHNDAITADWCAGSQLTEGGVAIPSSLEAAVCRAAVTRLSVSIIAIVEPVVDTIAANFKALRVGDVFIVVAVPSRLDLAGGRAAVKVNFE